MEKLLDILMTLLVVMTRHHANINGNFQLQEGGIHSLPIRPSALI